MVVKLTINLGQFLSSWLVTKGCSLQTALAKYFWLTRTALNCVCFSRQIFRNMFLPYCRFGALCICIIISPLDSCFSGGKKYTIRLWPNTARKKVPAEAVTPVIFIYSLVSSLIQLQVRKEAQRLLVLWNQQPEYLSSLMGDLQNISYGALAHPLHSSVSQALLLQHG